MRLIFLLFILLLKLYSNAINIIPSSLGAVDIKADQLIDVGKKLTFEEIEKNGYRDFEPALRYAFKSGNVAIWSHFFIQNDADTEKTIVLQNVLPTMNKLDVLLKRTDCSSKKIALGISQDAKDREFVHRYHVVKIRLAAHETIEVAARFETLAGLQTLLRLYSEESFALFSDMEQMLYGLTIGLLFSFTLFNVVLYRGIKDKTFLYYSFSLLSVTIFFLGINGFLYQIQINIDYKIVRAVFNIALHLNAIFTLMFYNALFELKTRAKFFYITSNVFIFIYTVFSILFIFIMLGFEPIVKMDAVSFVAIALLLNVIGIGILAVKKGWLGGGYYLSGIAIYAICTLYYSAFMIGAIEYNAIARYSLSIGIAFEMFFLALAAGTKIKELEYQKRASQGALLEHAKFITISQTLAGIIHQIRQPIVYLGTLITALEIRDKRLKDGLKEEDAKLTKEIRKSASLVDNTVMQFYNLYSSENKPVEFNVAEKINDAISMLSPEISQFNISLLITTDKNIKIKNHPYLFGHVLMIIISNAIKILRYRNVSAPTITIEAISNDAFLKLSVSDNAGGIDERLKAKLFTLIPESYEYKGFGIGLMLAKHITENKLKGSIAADNTKIGAVFTLILPLDIGSEGV